MDGAARRHGRQVYTRKPPRGLGGGPGRRRTGHQGHAAGPRSGPRGSPPSDGDRPAVGAWKGRDALVCPVGRCARQHNAERPPWRALPKPGARGVCRVDAGHGRGVAARRAAGVQVGLPLPTLRSGKQRADQHPTVAGWAVPSWLLVPAPYFVIRELDVEAGVAAGGVDPNRRRRR
jgi:hypothetical protein